jgi:hypothetical protein
MGDDDSMTGSIPSLSSMANEQQVRQAIMALLPNPCTTDDVVVLARRLGLECSGPVGGIIYCSCPAASHLPLVRAMWLIEFDVGAGELKEFRVGRGLIGP